MKERVIREYGESGYLMFLNKYQKFWQYGYFGNVLFQMEFVKTDGCFKERILAGRIKNTDNIKDPESFLMDCKNLLKPVVSKELETKPAFKISFHLDLDYVRKK